MKFSLPSCYECNCIACEKLHLNNLNNQSLMRSLAQTHDSILEKKFRNRKMQCDFFSQPAFSGNSKFMSTLVIFKSISG